MPSVSKKQHNLAKAACAGQTTKMPKKVGCEFVAADKAKARAKKPKKK